MKINSVTMSLKIGDKVRFLDEKGEGIISRFIDNRQALVQMDDGFEIPYLLQKLVPVFSEKDPIISQVSSPPQKEVPQITITSFSPVESAESVFLVFEPENPQKLTEGKFKIHVFNTTKFHIQFSISSKHIGKFTAEYAGGIGPRESVSIRSIEPGEIERWCVLLIDILFFSYDPFVPRDPVNRILKQKPARFYKEGSFNSKGLLPGPAIVIDLTRTMQKGQEDEDYLEEKDVLKILSEKEKKVEKIVSKQSDKNNIALEWEVDLHLEELVENIRGMNNAQMLDIQLRYFRKKLDEALVANIRKIIFIHGVGNGRLKQELRKILSLEENMRFQDASYHKYGFGATEVDLK